MVASVIGTVDLVDCVPIVGTAEESAIRRVEADSDGSLWLCEAETDPEDLPEGADPDYDWLDVTDQRPLGDFTHGRWAWIFANPRKCDPVAAKGKLGLWNWDGEA